MKNPELDSGILKNLKFILTPFVIELGIILYWMSPFTNISSILGRVIIPFLIVVAILHKVLELKLSSSFKITPYIWVIHFTIAAFLAFLRLGTTTEGTQISSLFFSPLEFTLIFILLLSSFFLFVRPFPLIQTIWKNRPILIPATIASFIQIFQFHSPLFIIPLSYGTVGLVFLFLKPILWNLSVIPWNDGLALAYPNFRMHIMHDCSGIQGQVILLCVISFIILNQWKELKGTNKILWLYLSAVPYMLVVNAIRVSIIFVTGILVMKIWDKPTALKVTGKAIHTEFGIVLYLISIAIYLKLIYKTLLHPKFTLKTKV